MLGEHGELAHSYFIYRSAVRVPFLLRLPVRPAVTRVDSLVGLVDVMPTLCGLLGAPIPTTTQGMDLSPLIRGDETHARRTLYCESLTPTRYGADALHGVVGERWKYIRSLRPELYRAVEDPGEENNVLPENPEVVEDMTAVLAAALDEPPAASEESRIVLDPGAVERLRALGYVGPAGLSPSDAGDRVDAKDLIDVHVAHRRAMRLISEKSFEEAEPLARAVVNRLPDFWEACSNLAKVTVGQKRWREAVPLLHRADELRHGQYEILVDLGLAYTELGELDRATESFRRAVPFDPAPPVAELNLARALFNQGKPEEAEPHLANVAGLAEGKGNVLVPLSHLLRDHGRFDEAAGHLHEALRRQPGNVQARIDLAEVLLRQRREQEAAEQLDAVLRTAGDDEAVLARLGNVLSRLGRFDLVGRYLAGKSGGDRAAAHRDAGMALIEQGHLEGARAELEAAIALDPRDVESHNGLGVVLASSGDLRGAQKAFERVLELDPDYAGAYLNLGMVALDAGQPLATVAAHFERAAKVDPSLAEAHFNLALARIRQGRQDEAVAGLRKTLELAPDSPPALNQLAWLYATATDARARDPAEAVRLALQACALTRNNDPYSLETLAVAYIASGDQASARETARRALELATQQGRTELAEELEELLQEHGG
jgi:tetratricopeptide (TPR) repeat protein